MPLVIGKEQGGDAYVSPFIGRIDHTVHVRVDVSALTAAEVDSKGYIKPGVPLRKNGLLVSGAGQFVYGVVPEAVKVAAGNSDAQLAAAVDPFVALAVIALCNRDVIEDNLGRALTANEIAAFDAAGSKVALTTT